MSSARPSPTRHRLASISTLLASAAFSLVISPASADAGLVIQVEDTVAPANGLGSFDVLLMNTGGTFDVSGFSVELSVAPGSGVSFTGVSAAITTAPYLFGTLQSPPLTFSSFPSVDFTASDSDMMLPGYVTLSTPGQSFGLENVGYSVAPGTATGPVAISIVMGLNTELVDVNADPLPFATTNGTITVTSSVVPEPPSIIVWSIAATGLAIFLRSRRGQVPGGRLLSH